MSLISYLRLVPLSFCNLALSLYIVSYLFSLSCTSVILQFGPVALHCLCLLSLVSLSCASVILQFDPVSLYCLCLLSLCLVPLSFCNLALSLYIVSVSYLVSLVSLSCASCHFAKLAEEMGYRHDLVWVPLVGGTAAGSFVGLLPFRYGSGL